MYLIFLLIGAFGRTYIPYQAHGFNDIPYMLQLVKKGTTYFKFDIAPADKESCLYYSNWTPEHNSCEVYENGFEICCLALRGDTSSLPVFRHHFNLSSEFIQALWAHPQFFNPKANSDDFYAEKKVFAFNFQYGDKFSTETREFLYQLGKVARELNVNILIGSNSFFTSYIEKCKTECDAVEKFIAESPFDLQTSSQDQPQNPLDRNFNVFYENIDLLCKEHWPEWIDETYSMIFWEPSHEYQVRMVRDHFEDPSCNLTANLRKLNRLRMASNLEPENIQVFWKRTIENENSFALGDQKLLRHGAIVKPKTDYHQRCNVIYLATETENNIKIEARVDGALLQTFNLPTGILKNLRISGDTLLLHIGTEVQFYHLNCNLQIQKVRVYKLQDESSLVTIVDNQYVVLTKKTLFFYSILDNSKLGEANIEVTPSGKPLGLNFDGISANGLFHFAVSYSQYETIHPKDQFKKVFLTLFTVDHANYKLLSLAEAKKPVDYGVTWDLKLYTTGGKVFVGHLGSDGLCQSAILLNNNEWNKCLQDKYIQYSGLTNVDHMMNYFWGSFEALESRVKNQVQVTGCDQEVMHAKLGSGDRPSFAIVNGGHEFYVAAEFVRYDQQGTFTQLFCGSSNDQVNATSGLVEFTFDVLPPQFL